MNSRTFKWLMSFTVSPRTALAPCMDDIRGRCFGVIWGVLSYSLQSDKHISILATCSPSVKHLDLGTEGLLENANMLLGRKVHQYIASRVIVIRLIGPSPKCGSERKGWRRRGSGEATLFWPRWREPCGACLWAASVGGGERSTPRKERRRGQVRTTGTVMSLQTCYEAAVCGLAGPLGLSHILRGNLHLLSPVSRGVSVGQGLCCDINMKCTLFRSSAALWH